jgi:hypothetical protein
MSFLLKKRKGDRASFGEIMVSHKGKNIPTSVGSSQYEVMFSGENTNFQRTQGNIPDGYKHRPDLISNLFMDSPTGWWIVCERNAIFDVFEQLNSGDSIQIPVRL